MPAIFGANGNVACWRDSVVARQQRDLLRRDRRARAAGVELEAARDARDGRALVAAEQEAVAVDLDLVVDEDHAVDDAGRRRRQLLAERQVLR